MVAHEAPGMRLPIGLRARLLQGGKEQTPVVIVVKNRLATVAAVHKVVDRSRILDPQLARHRSESTLNQQRSSRSYNTLFRPRCCMDDRFEEIVRIAHCEACGNIVLRKVRKKAKEC